MTTNNSTNNSPSISGDSGSISGSKSYTIYANTSSQVCGSTVKFVNSGTISTLNVTDSGSNTIVGSAAGNATLTGTANTGIGYAVLNGLTNGTNNCAIGYGSLDTLTQGSYNMGVGLSSLGGLTTGTFNVAIGNQAGVNYTAGESSNILFNNLGTAAENNVLRIGAGTGTGNGQLAKAFISGINGVTASNPKVVTINSSTDQMGVLSQLTVALGGTGLASTTAYGVICGGTTTTGNLQNAGAGSTGQYLVSNGASSLPTFQNPPLFATSVQLTSAQIKALNVTPVTIVPAQGAGLVIQIVSCSSAFSYAGTNAFTGGGACGLKYASGSGTSIANSIMTTTQMLSTNNYYVIPLLASIATNASNTENQPVVITNTGSAYAGNAAADNTCTIYVTYLII